MKYSLLGFSVWRDEEFFCQVSICSDGGKGSHEIVATVGIQHCGQVAVTVDISAPMTSRFHDDHHHGCPIWKKPLGPFRR